MGDDFAFFKTTTSERSLAQVYGALRAATLSACSTHA
jgi:hypothetical protein